MGQVLTSPVANVFVRFFFFFFCVSATYWNGVLIGMQNMYQMDLIFFFLNNTKQTTHIVLLCWWLAHVQQGNIFPTSSTQMIVSMATHLNPTGRDSDQASRCWACFEIIILWKAWNRRGGIHWPVQQIITMETATILVKQLSTGPVQESYHSATSGWILSPTIMSYLGHHG